MCINVQKTCSLTQRKEYGLIVGSRELQILTCPELLLKIVRVMDGPTSEMNEGRADWSAEGTSSITFRGARLKTFCKRHPKSFKIQYSHALILS